VGSAIQAVNAGVLIIAEGPFAQTGVLYDGQAGIVTGESDLSLVGTQPVQVTIANKVVYEIHDYPSTIGGESADSGDIVDQARTQAWGYLVAQNIAPIWVGEMGGSLDGVGPDSQGAKLQDEQAWANQLVAYLNGNSQSQGAPHFTGSQRGISSDWWAWGNLSGEEPDGTLNPDGVTLNPDQYAIYSQLQK
jgi:hypothetical protein